MKIRKSFLKSDRKLNHNALFNVHVKLKDYFVINIEDVNYI